jgi:hypothetical protein
VEADAEEEAAEARGSPPTVARRPPPEAAVTAVPANEAENEEKSRQLFVCSIPLYAFRYGSNAAEKNVVVFDFLGLIIWIIYQLFSFSSLYWA